MIGKKVRINPDIGGEGFKRGANDFMLEWQEIGAIGTVERIDPDGDLYVKFGVEAEDLYFYEYACYLRENEVIFVDEPENLI